MSQYISGDELADARNARGCGVPWAVIAGRLGCDEQTLRRLLGEPAFKPIPETSADDDCGLWAADRLNDVL